MMIVLLTTTIFDISIQTHEVLKTLDRELYTHTHTIRMWNTTNNTMIIQHCSNSNITTHYMCVYIYTYIHNWYYYIYIYVYIYIHTYT